MKHDPTMKPSGGGQVEVSLELDALVDEASMQSFPCSDAPAFTTLRVGPPAPQVTIAEQPPRSWQVHDAKRRLARAFLAAAAVLAAVDLWYVARRRISRAYLLDAAITLLLASAWGLRGRREGGALTRPPGARAGARASSRTRSVEAWAHA
jgi:hypothetical protein